MATCQGSRSPEELAQPGARKAGAGIASRVAKVMPISDLSGLPAIAAEVMRLQPNSIMDLGVGCGMYGVVCRQVLDGQYGRVRQDQWQRKIRGIEGWSEYFNPIWGAYDVVDHGDFSQMDISGYDLVLMIDSLEHLEPERGAAFLEELVQNNRNVIISVPTADSSTQGEPHGNAYECHRTQYRGPEFDKYNPTVLHQGYCRVMSIKGRLS